MEETNHMQNEEQVNQWISILLRITTIERSDLEYFHSHISEFYLLLIRFLNPVLPDSINKTMFFPVLFYLFPHIFWKREAIDFNQSFFTEFSICWISTLYL